MASTAGGVYDFPMREYSPSQGRWWTPDPAGLAAVDPSNPQSWNRYAYVNGMPLSATDPLGLLVADDGDGGIATVSSCHNVFLPIFQGGEYVGEGYADTVCKINSYLVGGGGGADGNGGGSDPWSLGPLGAAGPSCPDKGKMNAVLKNTPMAGEGADLLSSGQQFGVDRRFVLGLADAESSLGRNITRGAFNAWKLDVQRLADALPICELGEWN